MSKDDLFAEIEGRKVPTSKQLRKMGLMTRDGSIPNIKTKVSDDNFKLTQEQVKVIVWNLKKYSSVTFMKQLKEMLAIIIKSYEDHIGRKPRVCDIEIDNLKSFNESYLEIDTAIKMLLSGGNKSAIYKSLRDISRFDFAFTGRMRGELDWSSLGQSGSEKSRGLYVWIEKAIHIAFLVETGGGWTWPSPLIDKMIHLGPPDAFNYYSAHNKLSAKTGEIIPVTGIWNPYDFKSGCPSFLLAGDEFPNTEIATEKLERPEFFDEDSGELYKGWLDFEYQEHPSRWELLWEDKRYIDGTIPEEEKEYLDESCSFPNEPPEAVKISP